MSTFLSSWRTCRRATMALLMGACLGCGMIASCNGSDSEGPARPIVVLYENDVHCAIDYYSAIAGLRDAIQQSDSAYSCIVSSGDYLQGGSVGAFSRGQQIVDIMQSVGYSAMTLGNHEFDYGIERLRQLMARFDSAVVCCDLDDFPSGRSTFRPYIIRRFGPVRVAFVGVVTPNTLFTEGYAFVDYTSGQRTHTIPVDEVASRVQAAADEARRVHHADYVIVLSHLGDEKEEAMNTYKLVELTTGIDVILDAHSHEEVAERWLTDRTGHRVLVSQTGSKFANVGFLHIGLDGTLSSHLIPSDSIHTRSARVEHVLDSVRAVNSASLDKVIGTVEHRLTIYDGVGRRLVRFGECSLGNLVTDAIRVESNAQIALINGGCLRADLEEGEFTFSQLLDAMPYDNYIYTIRISGEELLDYLNRCSRNAPAEDGEFSQVSGIRYSIRPGHPSRVHDVMVLDTVRGGYVPLDLKASYTLATIDYCLNTAHSGILGLLPIIQGSIMPTQDAVMHYVADHLHGVVPASYAQHDGRIVYAQ